MPLIVPPFLSPSAFHPTPPPHHTSPPPRPSQYVPTLTDAELVEYEAILNEETVDIFKWITEEQEVPPEIDNAMMAKLKAYAKTSPAGQASPEAYINIKKMMSN